MLEWQDLVGKPYEFPSHPPESFDCWTLVKYVRGAAGLPCPLPFDDGAAWCLPGNLAKGVDLARPLWTLSPEPVECAMAVMEPEHVGVYLGGGVLHANGRGRSVIWSSLPVVKRYWPKVEWWTA